MENPFVPIYKKCNNGDNKEKFQTIRDGKLLLPRYIDLEFTNNCNFKCRFCPTGTQAMKRTRGFMSDEIFLAVCENIKKYKIPGVCVSRWGEPTLHPKCIDYLSALKNAGAIVHVNTNGSLLTDEQIKKLIDMKLDSIKFSFQGADEGTYNEMRFGGDYKNLLSCIDLLNKIRGKNNFPYIQISTTLTGETLEQIENFKNDVQNLCDYYNIGYTKLTHLNVDDMNIDENEKQKIKTLQKQETINKQFRKICPEAFDKLSINWNGDVTLCCSDYDNGLIVGNVLENNFQ